MGKELTRWAEGIPVPARTSSRGRRVDQTRGSVWRGWHGLDDFGPFDRNAFHDLV